MELNGTSFVSTTKQFIRAFEAYVSAGSSNAGNISVYDNSETYELLRIDAGEADAHAAIWTVPAEHDLYLIQWHGSEAANQEVEFAIWSRQESDIWRLQRKLIISSGLFHLPLQVPIRFPAQTDIALRVQAGQSTNVTGGFEGYAKAR